MIHESEFRISRRPYAVALDSMKVQTCEGSRGDYHWIDISAVWLRRRGGITAACVGRLWGSLFDRYPVDIHDALARLTDGRYGGDCQGRWDGEDYWGAQKPAEIERHLALLRPMLDNYPNVPPGYSGWWRYETPKELAAIRDGAHA